MNVDENEICGAPHPTRNAFCRQSIGHAGDHGTARRDVTWPQHVTVGMLYAYEAGLADLDEERLERAVQTVTAEGRIDIIENEENGDMASVITPPEFARKIIAEYARSSSKVETAAGDGE